MTCTPQTDREFIHPGPDGMLPGPRAWTDEQRRAIARRQGDLLLDASAGSGKTSVLAERFAAAVLLDGVDVGAILTITFTEKAAAELRDRIRGRLRQLGAHAAARRTEGAWISTIHGFCARLLRTHALAAGLDPRFTVLDAYASKPLVEGAFDDALTALAQDDPRTVDLIAAYTVPTLRAAILSVYDQLRSAGQEQPRLPEIPDREGLIARQAIAATQLCALAEPLAAELATIPDPGVRVQEALVRVRRCLQIAPDPELWPGELGTLTLPRSGAALTTDACEAYAAALIELRTAAGARAAAPYRDLLDGLLSGYAQRYRARKQAVSGLDFEDLELDCRALLRDDAELREHYRDRFTAIMVDEFQDTNRIQLELIGSIAHGNLFTVGDAQQSIYGFRHADVSLFRERSGRLAAEGARETLQTNFRTRPEIIDVLNPAFAEAMGDAFVELRAGRPADETAVPAGSEGPAVELIVTDKAAEWELEGMAAPWRLAEARALAARVAELVADGAAPGEIVVLMRATTDMRAYERALERRGLATYVIGGRGYWGHPQVLDLLAYLRALANPRDEQPLYGVLASPLVGASLDALVILAETARAAKVDPWRALRDPAIGLDGLGLRDREALAVFAGWFAAERRRSARASIEELIEAALAHTGYDLAMLAMPGGPRRLANVRKLMRLGREYEAVRGPDLRGFLALVVGDTDPAQPSDALREGEAPVEGEGLDAIRLMTIHRAKGLEFPIVCVADLGRSPRPPSAILRVAQGDRDSDRGPGTGRIGLRLVRAGTGTRESALDYTVIGDELRVADEAEERRLFYVAMTRARDRLLLSGAARFEGWLEGNPRRVGGGPIAWIAPALVDELATVIAAGGGEVARGDGRVAVRVASPEDLLVEPPAAGVAAGQPADGLAAPARAIAELVDEPTPATAPHTLSYSALTEYARCGYRFYAERVLGLPTLDADELDADELDAHELQAAAHGAAPPPGPRSGADRGILAHALLERLDFRRPVVPATDLARAAAARAAMSPPPGPEELDELAAVVRRFADTELCARLGRGADVRREQRFAFALDDDTSHPLVVGVLDVIAREAPAGHGPARPARSLVVDYKTDRLRGADPAAVVAREYAGQRLIYALAALNAGADEVEVVHCFLEAPEAPVSAVFTAADRSRLQAELSLLAAGVLAGRYRAAPDPHRRLCAGCPAQGGLCPWPLATTRRESADTLF